MRHMCYESACFLLSTYVRCVTSCYVLDNPNMSFNWQIPDATHKQIKYIWSTFIISITFFVFLFVWQWNTAFDRFIIVLLKFHYTNGKEKIEMDLILSWTIFWKYVELLHIFWVIKSTLPVLCRKYFLTSKMQWFWYREAFIDQAWWIAMCMY